MNFNIDSSFGITRVQFNRDPPFPRDIQDILTSQRAYCELGKLFNRGPSFSNIIYLKLTTGWAFCRTGKKIEVTDLDAPIDLNGYTFIETLETNNKKLGFVKFDETSQLVNILPFNNDLFIAQIQFYHQTQKDTKSTEMLSNSTWTSLYERYKERQKTKIDQLFQEFLNNGTFDDLPINPILSSPIYYVTQNLKTPILRTPQSSSKQTSHQLIQISNEPSQQDDITVIQNTEPIESKDADHEAMTNKLLKLTPGRNYSINSADNQPPAIPPRQRNPPKHLSEYYTESDRIGMEFFNSHTYSPHTEHTSSKTITQAERQSLLREIMNSVPQREITTPDSLKSTDLPVKKIRYGHSGPSSSISNNSEISTEYSTNAYPGNLFESDSTHESTRKWILPIHKSHVLVQFTKKPEVESNEKFYKLTQFVKKIKITYSKTRQINTMIQRFKDEYTDYLEKGNRNDFKQKIEILKIKLNELKEAYSNLQEWTSRSSDALEPYEEELTSVLEITNETNEFENFTIRVNQIMEEAKSIYDLGIESDSSDEDTEQKSEEILQNYQNKSKTQNITTSSQDNQDMQKSQNQISNQINTNFNINKDCQNGSKSVTSSNNLHSTKIGWWQQSPDKELWEEGMIDLDQNMFKKTNKSANNLYGGMDDLSQLTSNLSLNQSTKVNYEFGQDDLHDLRTPISSKMANKWMFDEKVETNPLRSKLREKVINKINKNAGLSLQQDQMNPDRERQSNTSDQTASTIKEDVLDIIIDVKKQTEKITNTWLQYETINHYDGLQSIRQKIKRLYNHAILLEEPNEQVSSNCTAYDQELESRHKSIMHTLKQNMTTIEQHDDTKKVYEELLNSTRQLQDFVRTELLEICDSSACVKQVNPHVLRSLTLPKFKISTFEPPGFFSQILILDQFMQRYKYSANFYINHILTQLEQNEHHIFSQLTTGGLPQSVKNLISTIAIRFAPPSVIETLSIKALRNNGRLQDPTDSNNIKRNTGTELMKRQVLQTILTNQIRMFHYFKSIMDKNEFPSYIMTGCFNINYVNILIETFPPTEKLGLTHLLKSYDFYNSIQYIHKKNQDSINQLFLLQNVEKDRDMYYDQEKKKKTTESDTYSRDNKNFKKKYNKTLLAQDTQNRNQQQNVRKCFL